MPATRPNVFALKESGLDAFLYADVGAEANGSRLTILSVLARLGKDPWAEAARWAALPKAAVIDSLAQSIAQMPLVPSALAGARDSAARLVQLLPVATHGLGDISAGQPRTETSKRVLIMILFFAFAVGTAMNLLMAPNTAPDVQASASQLKAAPEAPHAATGPLPKGAPDTGSR